MVTYMAHVNYDWRKVANSADTAQRPKRYAAPKDAQRADTAQRQTRYTAPKDAQRADAAQCPNALRQ